MQTERAYLSRHMEQLAERLSQEEILCDEEIDEDDEELKKLKNEKVNIDKNFLSLHLLPKTNVKTKNWQCYLVLYKFSAY